MQVIKFHELKDGAKFMFTQACTYGAHNIWQKATEDGDNHNCVKIQNTYLGIYVDPNTLVIPVY